VHFVRLTLILLVLTITLRPALAQSEDSRIVTRDEIAAPPDLLPESELPPAFSREVGTLNGRFLLLNMHGVLFHRDIANIYDDVDYAVWMNAGIIRAFATDGGDFEDWGGEQVGNRIADIAPYLRSSGVKLIVALVNNHKAVPSERPDSYGWEDGYIQLLLPFYYGNWRGAYLSFVRGLIGTVVRRGAQDVIWAWELGNELHTPSEPPMVMPFINAMSQEVRRLDPNAQVLAGTMGANHLEPMTPNSPLARILYCNGAISAYTLHAYDWISPEHPGDMPINWDFDNIVKEPCPNGRQLPILVEELGTSRELPAQYDVNQEDRRVAQELQQIKMVLRNEGVIGIGVWSAESPTVRDISRFDRRRGLTSYGQTALGSGSCYRQPDELMLGARCQLEQILRALPEVADNTQ
jgi:hypothetical protein